jgi:Neuraminidase (sialidase)
MVYFDGKEKKPGLYYSRMDGVAWASSPAKLFGNDKQQAGHPVLLSQADQVWLAWRELSGNQYKILMRFSDDGGRNWQDDQTIAVSEGETDYPFLLSNQHQVYLVWNTKASGLIVKKVK